jgi:hypothetical protein
MTSDRILQLSAAVEAMPEGPSRKRFSALLAELSDAEGVPVPVPVPAAADQDAGPSGADAGGHDAELAGDHEVDPEAGAPAPEPSPLDGLLGDVVPLPSAAQQAEQPVEEPKKRRWRRSS